MSTERFRVEQPAYAVLGHKGAVELRRYPSRIVAVTEVVGGSQDPKNEAFRRLAAYILGGNSRARKIAMTSPVEMEEGEHLARTSPVEVEEGGALRMSFFMPPRYRLEELPTPRDERVRLERAPARTVAALLFRGRVTDKRVARKKEELLRRVREAGWELEGAPVLAQYDGPFALPFLRRTEILVQVKSTHGQDAWVGRLLS
jgi:hypothetical protein